jgi:hypothetical protein
MQLDGQLTDFALNLIGGIREAQIATGKKTTGRSADELDYEIYDGGVRIIDGAGYIYFQEYGRAAGKMPPIEPIRRWIEVKGLDLNAWGVAKSIAKKGTLLHQGKDGELGLERIISEQLKELEKSVTLWYSVNIEELLIKNLAV